ncbi:hypothetical protein HYX00_04655 [Candidatus Woesearchaeota archaeon]|nr:hypothetical protein [Candidatus Woesearchaeota archaeon]
MSKIKKALMVFIVLLHLISFVYAQDYALFSGKFYDLRGGEEKIEFDFYNATYNICENEKKTIPILIVNKEAIDNKYTLTALGASWISLNVKEFSLPRKQSGVVFLDLTPGQNSDGNYNIKINTLPSIGNTKRELNLNINVEKCYSLNLELEKEEDKVCGGIKKQYGGEIINEGKQKSDIQLNVNGPNWINVDKDIFSVAASDKQKFELNADVPSNAKGVFNVILNAAIKNLPSIKLEKKLNIEVVPKYDCYKADVITDAKIANYYSNFYAPIKIRNSGIKQADYDISLEAPNWISIEPKKLTINPGQLGNLNLNINPDIGVAEGTYAAKILIKYEDMVYSKNINVVLSKNRFLRGAKSFFIFYQYYIYVALFILLFLFIFRRQISDKIKTTYKNYKIKRSRLKALEAARKARQKKIKKTKKEAKEVKKSEFIVEKIKHDWIYLLIGLTAIALFLFFLIYQFDFPISKEIVKNYYLYFVTGVIVSLMIIFIVEFYKPLANSLRNIERSKKKK